MDLKDLLYERLPELYRREDANIAPAPYPLKRFLDVLVSGGFNELLKYIEDFRRIQNIDECPKELLPLIAQQYGLDFPYDMDEASQRKFIKVLPTLYANKGTEEAFKYLAREIFGEGTNLKANMAQKPEDMDEEEWKKLDDWKKLLVYLEVNGETLKLDNKHINFVKFCEIIRPVNTVVIPYLAMFYKDNYDRLNRANDNSSHDYINEKNKDQRTQITEDNFDSTKTSESWKEAYSNSPKFYNRLNCRRSKLNRTLVANAKGITDKHLDIIEDNQGQDIRNKFIYDISLDVFKDSNEFNAVKKKIDEDVKLFIKSIVDDIRDKEIIDIDSVKLEELGYDTNTKLITDKESKENISNLDRDSYEVDMNDSEDSIKITKGCIDVYKNAFPTRLNVRGDLNKTALTNASGLTDYGLDITTDLNSDYAKRSKEGKNLENINELNEERVSRGRVLDCTTNFTRTRKPTLLNKRGLVLNRNMRTNDGNLRKLSVGY